jgi:hypothetical protein
VSHRPAGWTRSTPRLLLALLLSGCAPGPGSPRPLQSRAGEIDARELRAVHAGNLLEAIQLLRPGWIPRSGAAGVAVYFGSERMTGGVLELRSFSPDEVDSVEYLSEGQAQFQVDAARGPVLLVHPSSR